MELTDLVDEKFFLPRLMALQECLCDELEKAKGPGLCFCGLVPAGRPPLGLMNCASGSCGVAWVAPVGAFPYQIFPQATDLGTTRTQCAMPMAMTVQLGVARCLPRPKQGSTMPDAQDMFDATRLYLSDMAAVRRALSCCFPAADKDYQAALQSWEPLDPSASASGGVWTAVIG